MTYKDHVHGLCELLAAKLERIPNEDDVWLATIMTAREWIANKRHTLLPAPLLVANKLPLPMKIAIALPAPLSIIGIPRRGLPPPLPPMKQT